MLREGLHAALRRHCRPRAATCRSLTLAPWLRCVSPQTSPDTLPPCQRFARARAHATHQLVPDGQVQRADGDGAFGAARTCCSFAWRFALAFSTSSSSSSSGMSASAVLAVNNGATAMPATKSRRRARRGAARAATPRASERACSRKGILAERSQAMGSSDTRWTKELSCGRARARAVEGGRARAGCGTGQLGPGGRMFAAEHSCGARSRGNLSVSLPPIPWRRTRHKDAAQSEMLCYLLVWRTCVLYLPCASICIHRPCLRADRQHARRMQA